MILDFIFEHIPILKQLPHFVLEEMLVLSQLLQFISMSIFNNLRPYVTKQDLLTN